MIYLGTLCVMCCIVPSCTWCMGLTACGGPGVPKDASEAVRKVTCHKVMSIIGQLINFIACLAGTYYIYTVSNLKVNINK